MSVVQENGLRERFQSDDSALSRLWREAPYYPRCSDNKTATYSRPREFAIKWPYMQINRRDFVSWLIFDIDEGDGLRWEQAGLPPPNFVVQSVNGVRVRGAHLYYAIAPVCTSAKSRSEPIQYQRAVYAAMAELLRADLSYHSGPVAKTPGHPMWRTWELHSHEYSLGELCEYLELPRRQVAGSKGPDLASVDHSRNCTIFEQLRFYAYALVGKARSGSFERFHERLLNHAESLNHFPPDVGDLRFSDISAIAKSVARWTWDHYRGSSRVRGTMHFDPGTTKLERQQASAARTHQKRRKETLSNLLAAVTGLIADGTHKLTDTRIAQRARVDRRTVAKYREQLLEAFAQHLTTRSTKPEGLSISELVNAARKLTPQGGRSMLWDEQYGAHQISAPPRKRSMIRFILGVSGPFDPG